MLLEFLQFALETLERVSIVWGAGQMDLMCHWRRLAAHKSWRSLLPFTRSWKSRRFHFSCKWASIFGANGFFLFKKMVGGAYLFSSFSHWNANEKKKRTQLGPHLQPQNEAMAAVATLPRPPRLTTPMTAPMTTDNETRHRRASSLELILSPMMESTLPRRS